MCAPSACPRALACPESRLQEPVSEEDKIGDLLASPTGRALLFNDPAIAAGILEVAQRKAEEAAAKRAASPAGGRAARRLSGAGGAASSAPIS